MPITKLALFTHLFHFHTPFLLLYLIENLDQPLNKENALNISGFSKNISFSPFIVADRGNFGPAALFVAVLMDHFYLSCFCFISATVRSHCC
mmetsp:Transcript_5387/g.6684  ORF Transcript_5387/g.6684 Transcript_5387/m.6684 type:complete len:92 (+) Transcript_5387:3-278(+)